MLVSASWDAVGVAAEPAGGAIELIDVHLEVDSHACPPGLLDEAGDVGQRGLGGCRRRLLPRLVAEHPDHAAQLLEGLASRGPQQLGGLAHLRRRQVGSHLERAGVEGHQGDPVGEHVVHLAGDPAAFGHAGAVCVEQLIGFGSLGALAQGEEELAAGPHEHPPRDGRDHGWDGPADHDYQVGATDDDGIDQGARNR
jgi:hypothetical protein